MSTLTAVGGLLSTVGGVLDDLALLIKGNFKTYSKSPYQGWTGMWGLYLPQNNALLANSSMRVIPESFPAGTKFSWDVTPDPDWTGVNGYLHLAYGNYDDSSGSVTPRQVYTITNLAVDVDWSLEGDGQSGLLAECWLTPTAYASGKPTKAHEVAFFPGFSPSAITYVQSLPVVGAGSYTDRNGVTWNVRQGTSAEGQPYYMAYRPGHTAFVGKLQFDDLFAFLITSGKITGNEWHNGLAFGVEPHHGAGALTIKSFVPTYTGAARVPWATGTLSASPASSTTATLSWRAAPGATSHQYRVNGGAWTNTSSSSSHTVTGLTSGTSPTFEVRGVNATGNGVASNVATATLPVGAATEQITNGGFADDTGWSGFWYSGKSVSGGKAVFAAAPAYDGISQTGKTLVVGKYYEMKFTVSARTSGTIYGRLIGGTARSGSVRSANGTFTERLLVNTGNNGLELLMETGGTLSVDDVSLMGPYNTATVGGA